MSGFRCALRGTCIVISWTAIPLSDAQSKNFIPGPLASCERRVWGELFMGTLATNDPRRYLRYRPTVGHICNVYCGAVGMSSVVSFINKERSLSINHRTIDLLYPPISCVRWFVRLCSAIWDSSGVYLAVDTPVRTKIFINNTCAQHTEGVA